MLNLKILLFLNFFLLIFQHSFCIIQHNQRLLVESIQDVNQASGSNANFPLIKLLKLELKKLNRRREVTEIDIEINKIKKNFSFYISVFHNPCNEQAWGKRYNTKNAILGGNRKRRMIIEEHYTDYFTAGIRICGFGDRMGEVLILKLKKKRNYVCEWITPTETPNSRFLGIVNYRKF